MGGVATRLWEVQAGPAGCGGGEASLTYPESSPDYILRHFAPIFVALKEPCIRVAIVYPRYRCRNYPSRRFGDALPGALKPRFEPTPELVETVLERVGHLSEIKELVQYAIDAAYKSRFGPSPQQIRSHCEIGPTES
jgi:hypothetical protein